MKNIAKLFIGLMLVGVVFSSCNEAKDVLDVKFVAEYETELDINCNSRDKNQPIGVFNISEPSTQQAIQISHNMQVL